LERRSKKTSFRKSEGRGRERDKDKDLFLRESRKRLCRFCQDKTAGLAVDYKDLSRLCKFITDRGKIVSRRMSGNCAKHQRQVAKALRRARFMALLR